MKHLTFLIIAFGLFIFPIQAQSEKKPNLNWKTINGCGVSFSVPNDVEFIKDESVDTCEREYRSKNIIIYLTVTGWNLSSTEYSNWLEYCLLKTKIATKSADIITSYKPRVSENAVFENNGFDYVAMLHLPKIGKGNLRISTFSKTLENREKTIKIFKSVQINKS